MGKIAIGDVHGCVRTLRGLLEKLDLAPDDELIFMGDYVDRGPDVRGVVDLLLDLRERYGCTFLRGNHEAMMLAALDGGIVNGHDAGELWRLNGGRETVASYMAGGRFHLPERHLDFYRSTRLYADRDDFFFVHAGLDPALTIAENLARNDEDTFLWERDHLDAAHLAWEKPVVCGHTPKPEPINREKLLMIDTGCVFYHRPGLGRLCAVRLPERTFVFQDYCG